MIYYRLTAPYCKSEAKRGKSQSLNNTHASPLNHHLPTTKPPFKSMRDTDTSHTPQSAKDTQRQMPGGNSMGFVIIISDPYVRGFVLQHMSTATTRNPSSKHPHHHPPRILFFLFLLLSDHTPPKSPSRKNSQGQATKKKKQRSHQASLPFFFLPLSSIYSLKSLQNNTPKNQMPTSSPVDRAKGRKKQNKKGGFPGWRYLKTPLSPEKEKKKKKKKRRK
ncbi:hypothetical protein B0T19DRAFT_10256 [Cercophora scortea]|uniref:Uncharacterized protein n=1 Tax=Cercophora scortea TaxID=314031 RepID=A0AAE0J241_9PEZI|nr:hypothetical protein B0T19DRAFT_10256 [Cercophora scortea]